MSRRNVYSDFETEASLCAYEWLLELSTTERATHPKHETVAKLFSNYGYSAMRFIAMQAGCIVVELYRHCEVNGPEHLIGDDSSFDWEFVPLICKHLNWEALAENNQYGKGDWSPEPAEFLAIIIAKRALSVAA